MLNLINILDSGNYISFNIDIAKIFGLQGAVYCSEILNIYQKAIRKKKLINDEYIKINRTYIFERTRISIEDQLKLDANWLKINLLKKHETDPDIISLNMELLVAIVANEDTKKVEKITEVVNIKNPKGTKQAQKQIICNRLKDNIVCSNSELLEALKGWVDTICSNPNGFLSKQQIEIFQTTLNNYTKGNLDIALDIVRIATVQGYKNCEWAINLYEKSNKMQQKADKKANLIITNQVRANKELISKDEIF